MKRRARFSLRTLLVLISVTCLCLAVSAAKFHSAWRQRALVRQLEAVNVHVMYDCHETSQNSFDTMASSSVPKWLVATFGVDFFIP